MLPLNIVLIWLPLRAILILLSFVVIFKSEFSGSTPPFKNRLTKSTSIKHATPRQFFNFIHSSLSVVPLIITYNILFSRKSYKKSQKNEEKSSFKQSPKEKP